MSRSSLREMAGLITILLIALGTSACSESPEDTIAKVRALQNEGRIQESIPLLSKLIDSGNRDGEALYRYGRALSLTGHPGRGIWALDAALDDPEWFVQASHQIALDAYRAKNQELVLETLERLRNERTDSHQEDLAALMLELRVRVETRRQYEEALELAETILDDYPDEEEVIRLKAAALIGLKQTDEAYELIREAGILAAGVAGGMEGDDAAQDLVASGDTPEGAESADAESAEGDLDLELDLDAATGSAPAANLHEAYWCTVRATFKREAGEPEEAGKIVEECLERFPSDAPLVNEAIKLYSQLNRHGRILEVLRAANEEQPDNREMRLALVKYLSRIDDEAGAEAVLRTALDEAIEESKEDEGPPDIVIAKRWVDLGGYYVEQERREEALEAFDEALAILGERASPGFLFRHADALILAGRYEDALAIADRTPIEVHAPMIRGRVAFERGEFEEAIKQLDSAAIMWPNNAPIRYYMARSAEGVGDFDRAIEEYRQAMRADPKLSAARERLARLHLAEGRVRNAATILAFVSPRESSEASTEMRLLEIETQARLGEETNIAIPPTAKVPPAMMRRRAIKSLARGLLLQSDAKAAEEMLAKLETEIEAPAKSVFLRERVGLLLQNGEVDEALLLASKRAAARARDIDVAFALGRALIAKNTDLDQAKGILDIVVEAAPKDAEAWKSLGDIARAKGDSATARQSYERSLEISPDSWETLSPLLEVMIADGKTDEALERLRHFVNKDNPYHGIATLELAQRLGKDGDGHTEERIALARRAIRFGAGPTALELLTQLDPEAAAEYSLPTAKESASEPEKTEASS